jgi:hypothetical protein
MPPLPVQSDWFPSFPRQTAPARAMEPNSGNAASDAFLFVDREHSDTVLSALNELRLAGQLVDLVFVDAKGGKAMAHRVVVAGA